MQKVFKIAGSAIKSHYVSRWAGVSIIGHRRSISEHHYEVSIIALDILNALKPDLSPEYFSYLKSTTLEYALLHDLPEIVTGDISYITKRKYPKLKENLEVIEKEFYSDIGIDLDLYNSDALFLVKVADTISVGIEIAEQLSLNTSSTDFKIENVDTIVKATISKYEEEVNPELFKLCVKLLESKPWFWIKE